MQSVDNNGFYGKIQEFNQGEFERTLEDPSIDRVEVFKGTPKTLAKREKMVGKKYKVTRAYKKVPRVKQKANHKGLIVKAPSEVVNSINKFKK